MIFAIINLLVAVWMTIDAIMSAVAGDWGWVAVFLTLAAANLYVFIINPEVTGVKR